jgi:hypothetical protein
MDGTVREAVGLLSPAPRNAAKANVAFPASFRRVPDSGFGGPGSPYFTRG